MSWINSKSNEDDIILTSRVRIARNIEDVPFPHMLSGEEAQKIIDQVSASINSNTSLISEDFNLIRLKDMGPLHRLSMVEKHLVSMDLVNVYDKTAVLLNKDENVSIMINEEDHIRLQVIYPGLKLKEAYEYASIIEDAIEGKINYAYDDKLGYLTSCPTNIGTGIRASVMLHLPALTITKNISNILSTVTQVGMTIRGIFGEGSNAMGDIYQVSNQITLGLSEEEIVNNLTAVVNKVMAQEKRAREIIAEKQPLEIEDNIYRSLGTLRYARMLTTSECLNLLSKVRMGIEMGIIKDVNIGKLNELLVNVQPATLQIIEGRELDTKDRDVARAKIVRETIS